MFGYLTECQVTDPNGDTYTEMLTPDEIARSRQDGCRVRKMGS